MGRGMVHLYFGDGKGKTSAATGLAVRAAGCGKRVLMVQFLKGRPSGEVPVLEGVPGVEVMRGQSLEKFTWQMDEAERAQACARHTALLGQAMEKAARGECDLLVLDEALGACGCGLLDEAPVLDFVKNKPPALELVLTGRGPSDEMLALADYATEMRKVKHPFDAGIAARRGVEF